MRFWTLAAGMAAALAGPAIAGDLPPEVKLEEVNVKAAQGWYVRGDVGYAINTDHGGVDVRGSGSAPFDTTRFDSQFSGGLGVGYQFNDLFRADLTGDLFRGDFSGQFTAAGPCAGESAGGCSSSGSSSFKAGSLMLNGYVDLGTLAGFTPYVGAGLGATHMRWDDVAATSTCVGTSACGGSSYSDRYAGESSWRVTYALMAGVAYDIAPNMKFDIGYRFSHVGSGDMFGPGDTGADISGHEGALMRHEIRVGLRISTW